MKTTMTQNVDELCDQIDNLKATVGLFYDFKRSRSISRSQSRFASC